MFRIGPVALDGPLILAPLAGYSDLPFRLLCKELGADLCYSEMISCHGLVYQQPRTLDLLASCPEEKPVGFQLFGSDPAAMGEAAAILSATGPDLIDINMGCPVRKVTKKGGGAALMTDIDLAESITRAVVAQSGCPVTVKIRAGVDSRNLNAVEFARMAEASGVAAVTVHGRTWKQAFGGHADWAIIKQVKQVVSIPVIGNGDIVSAHQASQRMAQSGCDAVMIGRGALGNPWIFSPDGRPSDPVEISRGALKHLELIERYRPESMERLAPVKNHLGKYFKGFSHCSQLRQSIFECRSWDSLKQVLNTTNPPR